MKDSSKKTFQFPGEQVDVDWDANLCIHIGECGRIYFRRVENPGVTQT
jgi:uncharacterized Fe-S cluster protein YjdI